MFDKDFESSLISKIYDCTLNPTHWHALSEELRKGFNAQSIGLLMLQPKLDGLAGITGATGIPDDSFRLYSEYYSSIDPFAEWMATRPIGTVGTTGVDKPLREFDSPEFINDFWRPQGYNHTMGVQFLATEDTLAHLVMPRNITSDQYHSEQIEFLQKLVPHFTQALSISSKLKSQKQLIDNQAQVLDSLSFGILLVDQHGKICASNTAANIQIRSSVSYLIVNEQLRLGTRELTKKLQNAISKCCNSNPLLDEACAEVVQVDSFNRLVILPSRDTSISLKTKTYSSPCIVIFVSEDCPVTPRDIWKKLYRLTSAESHFLSELALHGDLAKTASSLNITVSTARTHLKRIFSKTSTKRQGQLLKRFALISAQIGNMSPP